MTNKEDEQETSIDELFRTIYSDELADLLDETDITLTDVHSMPNQSTNSTPDKHSDIVITDIESSPAKLKIGKITLHGQVAKISVILIIVLVAFGWFYQL